MLKCAVDHILQKFYTLFLTRFRIYKIASPPQTKITSKDDVKELVSLKFLHPCFNHTFWDTRHCAATASKLQRCNRISPTLL
jgi:hypothetical protein